MKLNEDNIFDSNDNNILIQDIIEKKEIVNENRENYLINNNNDDNIEKINEEINKNNNMNIIENEYNENDNIKIYEGDENSDLAVNDFKKYEKKV